MTYHKSRDKFEIDWDRWEGYAYENLRAKPSGGGFLFCCEVHGDKNHSGSSRRGDNGKILATCFAGCKFHEIMEEARRGLGYSSSYDYRPRISSPAAKPTAEDEAKREHALQLWQATRPLADSPRAQRYFESRGLYGVNSLALRFHPSLSHLTKQRFPGIVAKVSALDGSLLNLAC